MPDLSQIFYEGIREQVKRVVGLLGEERTEKGLNAFVNGASTWSHCFFAQALAPQVVLHDERDVARALDLRREDGSLNLVPVRIVYHTFDRASSMITKEQLSTMMKDLLAEYRGDKQEIELPATSDTVKTAAQQLAKGKSLLDVIKKIDYTGVSSKKLNFDGPTCAN